MYGNVRVAMEDFTVLVDYTIRKFCVQYVSKIYGSVFQSVNDFNKCCFFQPKSNYNQNVVHNILNCYEKSILIIARFLLKLKQQSGF